jgi:hypothetical protein
VTGQVFDTLIREGKRMKLRNLPLEDFWEENPPRSYLVLAYSGADRGYEAAWEISKGMLYLTNIWAEGAFKTSEDYVGDEALEKLWRSARRRPSVGTVKNIMDKLTDLALTGSASVKRSVRIVNALGEQLLSSGRLKPRDPGLTLYEAAKDASRACFSNEIVPVTVETLFPGSSGPAFAAWYSGVLRVGEGKSEKENIAFGSTFESTRLIECCAGRVTRESVETNQNFPVTRAEHPLGAERPLVPRTKDVYIQEAVQLGAKFWRAVKAWGEAVDLWTDDEEKLLDLACHENFVPSWEQAIGLWELRLQAGRDGCRIDLLHPPTMHLLD